MSAEQNTVTMTKKGERLYSWGFGCLGAALGLLATIIILIIVGVLLLIILVAAPPLEWIGQASDFVENGLGAVVVILLLVAAVFGGGIGFLGGKRIAASHRRRAQAAD